MKIGVLIPVHNALKTIESCLVTIRAQTQPAKIYIVNDGSDDGTRSFLELRPSLYDQMLTLPRRGWPAALNVAAQMAFDDGCDAVFDMAADDLMRLDCLEKAAALLPGNDFVCVYAQQIGAENVVQVSRENATLEDFKIYPPIVNYALIKKEVWETVGGYSDDVTMPGSYGYKEDWDFWIKVFKAGFTKYAVVKEPVYYYIMHPDQLHRSGLSRHEEAKKLILTKHGMME